MVAILSQLQDAEERLEYLIKMTEDYYQLVYDNLPHIERNIDFTEEETNLLINYFIETRQQEQDDGDKYLMSQALQRIKTNFMMIRQYLLSKGEIDEILEHFLGDKSRGSSFDTFLQKVKEIEGTLQDVTDISFNAIIFSAHLGEKGQGFRVISDHINDTSDYLEQRFINIDKLLKGLIDWHHQLQANIEGIATGQEKAVEEYIGHADKLFLSLTTTFQEVSQILRNMMNNVKEALSPFQELMALIQRQDILRQKMENTIKCIRLIKEKYEVFLSLKEEGEKEEEILNHTVFISKALGLVESLTALMSESLKESLADITTTLGDLLSSLQEIREDARSLALYLTQEKSIQYHQKKMALVDYTFQEVFTFMNDFMGILQEISNLVKEISSNTHDFSQHINSMEKELGEVQRRVGRLNKIKLLAKIELARMDQKGSNFGAEIEDIVKDINRTVEENRGAYSVLRQDLKNDLDNFDSIIVENQTHIDQAVLEVSTSIEQLETTNRIINQAVNALNKEIHDLYDQISSVHEEIKKTSQMDIMGQELLSLIALLKGQVTQEQEAIFQQFQITQWKEEDEELLELFNLFTSYLERFSAKEYFQEDTLDEGSEEGELTLF